MWLAGCQRVQPLRNMLAPTLPRARRKYCTNEPEWATATALLDEFGGAGWRLIGDLVSGSQPASELLASPFLQT